MPIGNVQTSEIQNKAEKAPAMPELFKVLELNLR